MIGVLIFAVDAKLRRTLEQLPQKDSAIAIVRIADDQASLVRLTETSNVDVVLAQTMPPPELLAEWRVRRNAPAWVFFLDPVDGRAAADVLAAGASAILPSSTDLAEIIATIRMVAKGLAVVQRQLLAAALLSGAEISNGNLREADEDHHPRLSKREIAVLTAITDGLSNKEIARRLGISFHTVKFHVASILEKLEVDTRTEAVFKAVQLGIVML
jgi:two-component system, NarL family, response regulator YdfI